MLGPPNSRKRRSEGNCKNNSTQSLAPRILDNYRNRYKKNKLSKGGEEALIVSRQEEQFLAEVYIESEEEGVETQKEKSSFKESETYHGALKILDNPSFQGS